MRCALLLADSGQQRLRFVAAPNIPDDYKLGIEPYLRIAPNMGSCGTAAFLRRPVYTRDTATDPVWENCGQIRGAQRSARDLVDADPFDGSIVLGTFAMYYGRAAAALGGTCAASSYMARMAMRACCVSKVDDAGHVSSEGSRGSP